MADWQAALTYIDEYWPKLIRENRSDSRTLIGLPHPYMVPAEAAGQHMFQEMYYWDSFFTALGLLGTPHAGLISGMAENMAALYRRFGVIPNASRFYFLSRSQPPFFTQMIRLGYRQKCDQGDANAESWLAEMMALAADEHETVWLGAAQPHHRQIYRGLSRHFDINYLDLLAACETGWDHSPRFDERCLAHLPVDLNSLLYLREQDLAWAAQQRGDGDAAAAWERRAEERAVTMLELMWDAEEGFFFDYDYVRRERNPYPSLAGFYPLFAGLATVEQAEQAVLGWLPKFEMPGGLQTTLTPKAGCQWAHPNGWAPLQWIVTEGLDRYGFHESAARLRTKWCDTCAETFALTGGMWEKYNVVTPTTGTEEGLYGMVKGFGWSNGVFKDFATR